jgi:hypothetical protein
MSDHAGVVCLIAAYEEEERIGRTVAAVLASRVVDEVLVVDDGSSDGTAAEARRAGAWVIRLERNAGKGQALTAGARSLLARPRRPDIVLLGDADLGDSAVHLSRLAGPISGGRADVTVARLPRQPGASGFGIVVRLARFGLRRLTGTAPAQPLSGQRAIRGDVLPWLLPFAGGFGVEVGMTIAAEEAGLRTAEVLLDLFHAPTGRDLGGLAHRGAQARDVAAALAVAAARRWHPLRRRPARPRPTRLHNASGAPLEGRAADARRAGTRYPVVPPPESPPPV